MYKIILERYFLELATDGQSDKAFLLTSGFCPQRVVCPCPGVYTFGKPLKNVYKIRIQRDLFETSKVCLQVVFFPCPGAITCIKSLKMCKKSDFKEIILKLATYGQREKAFLLSSKLCPQWIVFPCPGLYTYCET